MIEKIGEEAHNRMIEEVDHKQYTERIPIKDVTSILKNFGKSQEFKFKYTDDINVYLPNLIPYESKVVRIAQYSGAFLCEEFECTIAISEEYFNKIWNNVRQLSQNSFMLKYVLYSWSTDGVLEAGSKIAFYSLFESKANLRSKIGLLGRSLPNPSEFHALFLQLKKWIKALWDSELYKCNELKSDMFFLPVLSPSCVYVFGKEDYRFGLSTAYKFGDLSLEKFICPEIKKVNETYIFPESCISQEDEGKNFFAYSVGALFMFYSLLREPDLIPKKPLNAMIIEDPMNNSSNNNNKKNATDLETFEKSGALKKSSTTQNQYQSQSADRHFATILNNTISEMIGKRDFSLMEKYEQRNDKEQIKDYQDIFGYWLGLSN